MELSDKIMFLNSSTARRIIKICSIIQEIETEIKSNKYNDLRKILNIHNDCTTINKQIMLSLSEEQFNRHLSEFIKYTDDITKTIDNTNIELSQFNMLAEYLQLLNKNIMEVKQEIERV